MSTTMKAWAQTQPGACDYKLEESRPVPKPKAGQIIVKNKFVGSNPIDYKCSEANYGGGADAYAARSKVYGVDGAGIVAEVGEGVTGLAVGDAVWYFTGINHGDGAYAEFSVAEAGHAFKIPEGFSMEQAGTAACVLMTCAVALIDKLNVQPGDQVLIRGSAGGVGHLATQIAKALGASLVVGICSGGKFDFSKKEAKCDECIDYTKGEEHVLAEVKRLTNGAGFPKVFDTIGEATDKLFPLVQNGGSIASILPFPLDINAALAAFGGNITCHHVLVLSYVTTPWGIAKIRAMSNKIVNEMIVPGKVAIAIGKRYKFSELMDAQREIQTGRVVGKNVILVE